MENTRTLEKLRNSYEGHLYLSFNNQKVYDEFLKAAEDEGFRFGERLPTEHVGKGYDIIALEHRKQLAFCGFISHMAYNSRQSNIHKVDYEKYVHGDVFIIV